jgi:hypothetical protein
MSIDPIFWDLVGLPENRDAPFSFRFTGAWTCRPPGFAEIEVPESEIASDVAERILSIADEQLNAIVTSWSTDDFLKVCQERGADQDSYLPCTVSALIAMGREPEAASLCEAAKARGSSGGFTAPEGSFPEMAANWLKRSMAASTRH